MFKIADFKVCVPKSVVHRARDFAQALTDLRLPLYQRRNTNTSREKVYDDIFFGKLGEEAARAYVESCGEACTKVDYSIHDNPNFLRADLYCEEEGIFVKVANQHCESEIGRGNKHPWASFVVQADREQYSASHFIGAVVSKGKCHPKGLSAGVILSADMASVVPLLRATRNNMGGKRAVYMGDVYKILAGKAA